MLEGLSCVESKPWWKPFRASGGHFVELYTDHGHRGVPLCEPTDEPLTRVQRTLCWMRNAGQRGPIARRRPITGYFCPRQKKPEIRSLSRRLQVTWRPSIQSPFLVTFRNAFRHRLPDPCLLPDSHFLLSQQACQRIVLPYYT